MEKRIPTEEQLDHVGFIFWKKVGQWDVYRRQNAHTGPGMLATTEYVAIGEDDFYRYETGHEHGGQSPLGLVSYLRQWLEQLR